MDLSFCINNNSFPSENVEIGNTLFNDAIQGVLNLITSDNKRIILYYDSNDKNLSDLEIAENYTYENFRENCEDEDLRLLLYEIEDKSPALDELSEEQINELSEYNYYITDEAFDKFPDVYGIAWILDAYLLSLATSEKWLPPELKINMSGEDGKYITEGISLKNVSTSEHGLIHLSANTENSLEEILTPHLVSREMIEWHSNQIKENKKIINNKLKLAVSRNFNGGLPLFETLNDGDGLREIRMHAYAGGAIRILYKNIKKSPNQIILIGFIKHSDNEGYGKNIPLANEIYENSKQ